MAHLSNNGGIQSHSAGEFFPLRIVAQGDLHSVQPSKRLLWLVVGADGAPIGKPYYSALTAHACAYAWHTLGILTESERYAALQGVDGLSYGWAHCGHAEDYIARHTRTVHDHPVYYGLRDRHGRPYVVE